MKRDEDDINLILYYDIKLTENSSLLFNKNLNKMTEKKTKKKTSKKAKTTPPSVAEEEKDDATPTKQQQQQPKEEEQQTTTPRSTVKKLPQITVARLLNETQLGVAMHKRIVKQMTELRHVNGNEKFLQEMCTCLLHVLLEYKVYLILSSSLFVLISSSLSSFDGVILRTKWIQRDERDTKNFSFFRSPFFCVS